MVLKLDCTSELSGEHVKMNIPWSHRGRLPIVDLDETQKSVSITSTFGGSGAGFKTTS